ncbi:MAG TPA: DNA-binding protein [Firmicutes bacterium]|nr:DNA-binding protein [Candidatus Fermentithermobacillaceae bacterium]
MKKRSYSSPEHVHEIIMLRDIYEGLLPPRQRQVAYLKFDEDLSLSEMAQRLGISRQGCDDAIRRCVRALFSYEDRLGIKQKLARKERVIDQALELAQTMSDTNWQDCRNRILEVLKDAQAGGEIEDGI